MVINDARTRIVCLTTARREKVNGGGGSGVERTTDTTTVMPFVKGLLATVGLGVAIATTSDQDLGAVVPLAFGMGFVAAVLGLSTFLRDNWVADLFYSGLGVLGFAMSAAAFLRADGCSNLPAPGFRIAAFALLVAVSGLAVVLGMVRFGRGLSAALGLGLFGALEILVAVSTFLGDKQSSGLVLAVLIPLAGVLGWFAVSHTDVAVGIGTVAVGYLTVLATQVEDSCSTVNLNGVVLIVGYCIAYFVTSRVGRFFSGRGQ